MSEGKIISRGRSRIVVAGCGFAGSAAASTLTRQRRGEFEIIAIDKQNGLYNYPVLPRLLVESVAKDKVEIPYRRLFDLSTLDFRQERIQEIDAIEHCVRTDNAKIRYDYLVLGFGSRALPLPQDAGVSVFYPKSLRHLVKLRQRIDDVAQNLAQSGGIDCDVYRFAVVGGGLTGVEFAGALREAADRACATHGVDRSKIEISLYEARSTLAVADPEAPRAALGEALRHALTKYGVRVCTKSKVERVSQDRMQTADGEYPVDSVVCCIGASPNLNVDLTGLHADAGGFPVDRYLRSQGYSNVFVVGDALVLRDHTGTPRRDLRKAHCAIGQGKTAARNVVRGLAARNPRAYRARRSPTLAMINSRNAVFEYAGLSVSGRIAGLLKRWLEIRRIA